jgi:hypothetical protein
MRPELQWARDTVVSALAGSPVLAPWAFEYTPASSDAADTTYLAKVREATVVIWLVGEETTPPVRNEIAEALGARKRLWVFLLPAKCRDDLTCQLLLEARDRAKSADAADEDELRRLLALTFSDEVIRALQDQPGLTRLAALEQLARASRERMVARWQATGLPESAAIAFADDLVVGAPPAGMIPSAEMPLRVIVGDVGSGKSVIAERLLQSAILEARRRASAPVPVWLHARDATPGLERVLLGLTRDMGDIRQQGTFAVIDGADEVDSTDALHLFENARVLVRSYPDTRLAITTRPIAGRPEEQSVMLPLLSEEQARDLVGRVAGYEITIGEAHGWPPPLAEAVRRPLFAILLGLNRRDAQGAPPTTGALLASLAEYAAARSRAVQALPWLQRLAVASTDSGDAPVRLAEVGDFSGRTAVTDSRMVQVEGDAIRFTLPILTQWFAAQSLQAGEPAVAELVADQPRLDRWRYALAIAIATGPAAFVNETMGTLARQNPGFAARVVEESVSRWAADDTPRSGPADPLAVGHELRKALVAWSEGIAPLGAGSLARDQDGELAPLGIAVYGTGLTWGWYVGGDVDSLPQRHTQEVVELPHDISILGGPYADWLLRRAGHWSNEPGWAWRWALDEMRAGVATVMSTRSLPAESEPLTNEALWLLALKASGRGSLWSEPVDLQDVESAIADVPDHAVVPLGDRFAPMAELRSRIAELRSEGESRVHSPWPGPDRDDPRGGWIWSPYSPERQLERVRAVYEAALSTYELVVDRWLPLLAPRLRTAAMLPAVLRGSFKPGKPVGDEWPTLGWYFVPAPPGEESRVEIAFGEALFRDDSDYDRDHDRLIRLRPEASGWISSVYTQALAGDIFQGAPLAPLVYGWIERDLTDTNWGK